MSLKDGSKEEGFYFSELTEIDLSESERSALISMRRVQTKKPLTTRQLILPALILFLFLVFVMVAARYWIGIPIAFVVCLAVYIITLSNSPTFCPECNQEMDVYCEPHPGIQYDWCRKCKCYSNLRRTTSD